jgi:uncharacterized Zn finger protein
MAYSMHMNHIASSHLQLAQIILCQPFLISAFSGINSEEGVEMDDVVDDEVDSHKEHTED